VETDRPGQEVSKEHREVIMDLIDNQGWAYKLPIGNGYPRLLPADPAFPPIRVPKTGHAKGRAFSNWLAVIRRSGGHWPPERQVTACGCAAVSWNKEKESEKEWRSAACIGSACSGKRGRLEASRMR